MSANSASSQSLLPGMPPLHPDLKRVEKDVLSIGNAEPNNWEWESRAAWKLADEDWQAFKTKWNNAEDSPDCILSLKPLPMSFTGLLSSIFVREDYVTMFDYVWAQALPSEDEPSSSEDQALSLACQTGVIIIGQPGTGKTLFQFYLLVRLLQLKQVVLFSLDGEILYLFYHDGVYRTNTAKLQPLDPQSRIPQPKQWPQNVFIWSLINIKMPQEPEWFLVAPPCLPVQTTSPNQIQYKIWDRKLGPMLTGLPLWTRDELEQGLPHQRKYQSLMHALRKYEKSKKYHHIDRFPGARALLLELEENNGLPPSPKDAISHLLDTAIEHFGYSPRDVFDAVFNYKKTTQSHQKAFNITYKELTDSVSHLASGHTTNFTVSNKILVLSPVYSDVFAINWRVNFKSMWVAKNVMKKWDGAEKSEIRKLLKNIPEASSMVDMFEHNHQSQ